MDEPKYCPYCMSQVKDNGTCPNCGLTEGSYVPAPHHLLPGTLLQGRYLLGRVLGEGGFGITYVGRDTRLGVKIAVKEYYPVGNAVRNTSDSIQVNCVSRTTGSYERGKEKFLKEARTMGKLEKEPQIVAVKDFFEENNTAYIVMEYIEGTTLKELTAQRGGKIPADELFQMIKPLFPALQRMHDLGLIHRDISPDNLMLENGNIKLLDFGCAKEIFGEMMQNQQTQTLILKHGYSPFEQYQMSNTQGPWTDVYALGASIYYCLTGGPPPRSTDRIMNDEIVPPHKLGVKIDPRQEAVLMRALAVKSMDRYRSMKEFSAALYNEPLAEAEPDKPIKLNNRKPRKVKQPVVKPNDLTVREGRIEVPVPENQEEPEKLFVTDEVPVTESAVDDTSGETPETPEETTPETSLSKKRLAFVIVAMVVVIALAVTAIVLAVTGTKKSSNNDDEVNTPVTTTAPVTTSKAEEEASVEPFALSDVDIWIGTAGEGSGVIEEGETELLESFYAAISQDGAYIAVTADSADIKLALHIHPHGWQYVERCTAVRNDDGTYTTYFSCQDIIDLVSDLNADLSDILCVYIDSLTWSKAIHVTGFEFVDEAFFFPMNIEITGGDGEVWYEVYAYGDEVSAQLIVPSPYHQLKDISITDIDGNVVDYTITYFGCDSYDGVGEVIHYDFTFIMPVYGANISVELYDPTEELSLTTIESHEGYPSELDVLKIDEADFTDEDLYLCIYYDYQENGSHYVGVINVGDWNGDYAQVYIVMDHDCGYEYIPLTVLKQRAEELGYDVSDGFFFWIDRYADIISVDLATTGTVERSSSAAVTTTAVTTTAPATTTTPTTTATRDTITTICLWQGYVVDEIDVDYTDEDLYLEITFKLTSNENDYIYWAVGGIVPLTVEGWQDSVLTLPSYKDCKGTYRIAISELVDIITDAGYDMSDNVDIIINWWTDVNGKDENADKFTSVISMRVGTANELDSNPVEIASTISYPWTLEYTEGIEYQNDGGVAEDQWLIDGIVAGEQEEAGAFTLGKVAFIAARGEHMMEFIEAIQGEDAYIELVSYAPRSSHLTFNIQFSSDYKFLEFIPVTDDPGDDPYIPLYTVTENSDGTITYLFSCSELLEIFEEKGYDVIDICLVSLNCEEGTVFKSFSVIQQ